jgi:hypothetical protein
MAWRCDGCTRYWGHCRKVCPLCRLRVAVRIVFRRRIPDAVVRKSILQFAGSYATCVPLPRRSLCLLGSPRNCRCSGCRSPADPRGDRILLRLARKAGRGRAVASRWVHLLSGIVAMRADHGILHGMLLAAECCRGPHVSFLWSRSPELLFGDIRPWVLRWLTAIFLQYVGDRSDLRGLVGTSSSVYLRICLW